MDLANAEFIVRACNAHDDLLAALKAITETYLTKPGCAVGYSDELAKLARAVIAKAGKE